MTNTVETILLGRGTDSLGLLALVVAARNLELLNESNVTLLGLLGGDALIDDLLPGILLGLTLFPGKSPLVIMCSIAGFGGFAGREGSLP